MKQPKRLTRNQKEIVINNHLNPREYALVEDREFFLRVIHKQTGICKTITKFTKKITR